MSECEAAARRGLELLEGAADDGADRTRITLLLLVGSAARSAGAIDIQREYAMQAASLAEALQDPESMVRTLNALGILMSDAGISTAYLALLDRAMKIARDGRVIFELGRSLSNMCSETYPNDLDTAATLAAEGVEVSRQVGDNYMVELALTNGGFTWLLRGDWDLLVRELTEQLEGRDVTVNSGVLWLTLSWVYQARGEALPGIDLPSSEDPYDQLVNRTAQALARAGSGDLSGAAADAAAAVRACVRDAGMREDFEVLWAPAVELQLEAGDLGAAAELLELAGPSLGGRSRAVTRGMVPRLRGLLALARGEDPETDLREAALAFEESGATYLLARTRLELARWLQGQGRGVEAAPLLAAARETFVALRATPSVIEVDALVRVPVAT
jgi:hypothetical protein